MHSKLSKCNMLKEFTMEELKEEIKVRENILSLPEPICEHDTFSVGRLLTYNTVVNHVASIWLEGDYRESIKDHIYETVMKEIFGDDIFHKIEDRIAGGI